MKITDARVFVSSPSRNFVTLKVLTDAGVYGLGDATLNGREKSVAAYLEEHVLPCLVGRDPFQTEDIWQYFYRGAYWRRGPVTMTSIAAIDVALWDIKAKSLGVPLYQLLGGKSRERIQVYCHANGADIEAAVDDVGRHIEQGYRAIRVQSGVPGMGTVYGVGKAGKKYEPAQQGLPEECAWSTSKYLAFVPRLFQRVRDVYGDGIELLHDVHHRLTPVEAARLGKDLEPFRLLWLEDPVTGELQEGLRLVRQHTVTPLAIGEVFNSVYDCLTLITEQLVDYIRMTVVHGGGVSSIMKLAHLMEPYHVRTGFHGATDLSPVTMAAALNVNTAINNFGIQEHMPHDPLVDEVFPHAYRYEAGSMYPGDAPGLGVDFNEELAAKYPYRPAYLPVNRKEDGTLWNW